MDYLSLICKCTLLVGTSSFESFSETLVKGKVNIGPYTFEVEVPKNNTIWCWTGGREGHFRKICAVRIRQSGRKRCALRHAREKHTCILKTDKAASPR